MKLSPCAMNCHKFLYVLSSDWLNYWFDTYRYITVGCFLLLNLDYCFGFPDMYRLFLMKDIIC